MGVLLHNNGSLIFVLDKIYGCVQCYIVNNTMFEFFVLIVCMYCKCYHAYLGIKSAVGIVQILLLLWFFSHELLDTRYISSLRTHQIDKIIITL